MTHDLLDVLALADRVVVLESGHIVEAGTVAEVLTAPRSAFAAELAGVNVVHGDLREEGVLSLVDDVLVSGRQEAAAPVGATAFAVFSPSSVAVYLEPPHGSPRNVWPVEIESLSDRGGTIRVRLVLDNGSRIGADLTAAAVAELGLRPGSSVWAVVKAQEIAIHPSIRPATSSPSYSGQRP